MKRWSFAAAFSAAALAFTAFLPVTTAVAAPENGGWDASAAQIKLPDTVPSFDGFTETAGTWTLTPGARIVTTKALAPRARMLATELTAYLGSAVPAVIGQPATAKDVSLVLDEARDDLGAEGFEMTIGASGLVVTAKTDAGIFYGTRTVSQLLRQEDRGAQQLTLPGGTGKSIPAFPQRGVILCACQINVSPEWVDQFLDDIADLHINQVLMELKAKSSAYPDTNTWSYYTRDDVAKFVQKAKNYHIDVIPEINSPGHMNIWLENSPQYQLVDTNGNYHPDQLDISKPEARAFYKKLIDEYDDVFDSNYWHMGADEYTMTGGYQLYPQLTKYAQDNFGANATANDAFNAFINEIDTYVKGKGKTLRVFNDGIYRSAKQKLDKSIVVDYWLHQWHYTASQFLADGYSLMNTSQSLYWSRQLGFGVNSQNLYDTGWDVGTFDDNQKVDKHDPHVLGARVSLWPDASFMTENEVKMQTADSLAFLAQMTWSDSHPWPRWEGDDGMKAAVDAVGKPTVRAAIPPATLPSGSYALPELSAGTLANAGPWLLTKTYDDYYQIKDTKSGKCLTIDQNGAKHLQVVTEVGAKAVLAECQDPTVQYPNRTSTTLPQQKWQVVQRGADKVSLRNAVTVEYLAVADGTEKHVDIQGVSAPEVKDDATLLGKTLSGSGNHVAAGTVAQFPHDLVEADGKLQAKALFSLDREMSLVVEPGAITDTDPTHHQDVTVQLYAPSNKAVGASTLQVKAPEGWKILPEKINFAEIPAGGSATATFRVANTTGTTGAATFTWDNPVAEKTGTLSLTGALGPRVCSGMTDISADSEAAPNKEPAPNGYADAAFDGNDSTYWHTMWGPDAPLPHWLVFNPTHALTNADGTVNDMLTLEYLPRRGANGKIKDFKIYVSPTKKAGDDDWGEPIYEGSFENNGNWHRATFDTPVKAQFVKLLILSTQPADDGNGSPLFTSAASICVSSRMPAVDIAAPEQPADPITPGVELPNVPAGTATEPIALQLGTDTLTGQPNKAITPVKLDLTVAKTPGYSLEFAPELPEGLSFDPATSTIVGTPKAAFDKAVTVTLTQGTQKVQAKLAIKIAELDTTALQAAVDAAGALRQADYTVDSWSAFAKALADAKRVLKDPQNQAAVNDALSVLQKAQQALQKKPAEPVVPDTQALQAAVKDAAALRQADYTADSWQVFAKALADAKRVLKDPQDQAAVNDALAVLQEAQQTLQKKPVEPVVPDTEALQAAVKDAVALRQADYTADSWQAFAKALADAKRVLKDPQDQDQVNDALSALQDAQKALKKAEQPVTPTPDQPDKPKPVKPGKSDVQRTPDTGSSLAWMVFASLGLLSVGGVLAARRRNA